ncbi:MAG: D-alanyl-D-alanine carboxypeptidase [Hellea sp.]|nr:D-alanyl-D-alanine carboxypeptidase [Hellea sp.]
MRLFLSIILWLVLAGAAALADTPKRYASIVVDADSLEIVHARQIDEPRYPASLTKVMTLYLVFDAINAGEIRLDEKLIVSANAARTPPVGLGLRSGQTITVDQAIQAVAVRSSNDAAVVLAERIAGSEDRFALQMTQKARELGLQRTTFKTANGLPHPDQKTTARDMAKLASAVLNHHSRYYHYFGQTEFTWKGYTRRNTNGLLHSVSGVDGFKTGFTNDSGYNLIISAQRDGRRVIAVVLGGASGKSRNQHMSDLVERGFKTLNVQPVLARAPMVVNQPPTKTKVQPQMASAITLRKSTGELVQVVRGTENIKIPQQRDQWSIQLGAFTDPVQADAYLTSIQQSGIGEIASAQKLVTPVTRRGAQLYRARLTGLPSIYAHGACQKLAQLSRDCLVIAPGG